MRLPFTLLLVVACNRKASQCIELHNALRDGGARAVALKDPTLEGMRSEHVALEDRQRAALAELADAGGDAAPVVDRVRAGTTLDVVANDERALVDRMNAHCAAR